jgi:hypothetical protein
MMCGAAVNEKVFDPAHLPSVASAKSRIAPRAASNVNERLQ